MEVRVRAAALAMLPLLPFWLHAQCPDGSPPPCAQHQIRAAPKNSVAVLYFENLSPDTTDAYLADGLTEDVTAKLGEMSRLAVISRAAVRRVRDPAVLSTADLGRALNATYLVSGSVRRGGDRLRVTVELVRAATGARVWGGQYDRTVADLLEIEADVAQAVATGIAGRLLPAEHSTLAARPTRSPQAYDHYLRGNRLLWRQADLRAALEEFEAALRLDSTFVAARGRLAYAYGALASGGLSLDGLPVESLLTRGAEAVTRALREDSAVSDAWLGRAIVLFFGGQRDQLAEALESIQRAVELNPGDDLVHNWYAVLLRRLGRFAEADAEYHRALLINPMRYTALHDLGFLAYSLRRYREALQWFDSAVTVGSTRIDTYMFRARARAELEDLPGAIDDATHAVELTGPSPSSRRASAELAELEARSGQMERARARLQRVFSDLGWPDGVPTAPISVRNAYDPALAALVLGERGVALAILEHAQPRGPWLWSYLIFPGFDALRDDPRFSKIFEESKPPNAPDVPR